MAKFDELWPGGLLFAQAEHFRLSTDTVLLASFVDKPGSRQGIDLGCASGAAALLLMERMEKLRMTGLEILPEAAKLAKENVAANGFSERSAIVTGDIRAHRRLFSSGSFDLVISNPPYYPPGSGYISPDEARAGARSENLCTLEDICTAAAFLCRTGGSVYLVHKPERMSELFCKMSRLGIEPKRLRLVCHRAGSAPSLILVEGRRGGKPGLKVEKDLILFNPDGSETEEYKKIYHR